MIFVRRIVILAIISLVALGGCVSLTTGGGETTTETRGVMDAKYLGLHESHNGRTIENVQYDVYNACKAFITITFAETPPEDTNVSVWFYQDGELVDGGKAKVGELDNGMRENVEFDFCEVNKYDSFRIATEN